LEIEARSQWSTYRKWLWQLRLQWLRAGLRHLALKGERRDPNMFGTKESKTATGLERNDYVICIFSYYYDNDFEYYYY